MSSELTPNDGCFVKSQLPATHIYKYVSKIISKSKIEDILNNSVMILF